MSIEHLKSMLNSEFVMLPYRFDADVGRGGDDADSLAEKLVGGVSADELFHSQGKLDRSKGKLTKKQFKSLVAIYLQKFISSEGFQVGGLEREIKENRNTFERHLGKEWVYFLTTLIKLHKEIDKLDKRPRGLIGRSA